MPAHERRRLKNEAQAHRSPTLVGCAIAVRKDYFHHIGSFDDGMNVWGGENIELAFRTWMCGGQVRVLKKLGWHEPSDTKVTHCTKLLGFIILLTFDCQ